MSSMMDQRQRQASAQLIGAHQIRCDCLSVTIWTGRVREQAGALPIGRIRRQPTVASNSGM
jgi:hypothetical protein